MAHRLLVRRSSRYLALAVLLAATAAVVALVSGRPAQATPPSGLSSTPLAAGTLPDTIRVKLKDADGGFGDGTAVDQIVVVRYELEPGGTFGWHQHGGPVWAVVTQGTLTYYAAEGGCQPEVFPAGHALLDPGNRTHIARNEGEERVVIYAAFMLPEGGQLRVDTQDPGTRSF